MAEENKWALFPGGLGEEPRMIEFHLPIHSLFCPNIKMF